MKKIEEEKESKKKKKKIPFIPLLSQKNLPPTRILVICDNPHLLKSGVHSSCKASSIPPSHTCHSFLFCMILLACLTFKPFSLSSHSLNQSTSFEIDLPPHLSHYLYTVHCNETYKLSRLSKSYPNHTKFPLFSL